jgi:hypothetical protein
VFVVAEPPEHINIKLLLSTSYHCVYYQWKGKHDGVGDPPPLGLIVAVPIFLCINIAMAVIGARWMNRLSHNSSEDVLTAHYLGGRSFGPWLTLGTMFASLYSGFTIIGIPNGAVSTL